jgi:hypothetical protein
MNFKPVQLVGAVVEVDAMDRPGGLAADALQGVWAWSLEAIFRKPP